MLDEGNAIPQLTALRDKLTSVNGRIWSLLGQHDAKRARENFNGIAELERYVGELKRRSGKLEEARRHYDEAKRLADLLRQDTASVAHCYTPYAKNAFEATYATRALDHVAKLLESKP